MERLDRPFVGIFGGKDLRDLSREELYDTLIGELQAERYRQEQRDHANRTLDEFRRAREVRRVQPWWAGAVSRLLG